MRENQTSWSSHGRILVCYKEEVSVVEFSDYYLDHYFKGRVTQGSDATMFKWYKRMNLKTTNKDIAELDKIVSMAVCHAKYSRGLDIIHYK